jgi:hypothetical protein
MILAFKVSRTSIDLMRLNERERERSSRLQDVEVYVEALLVEDQKFGVS